MERVEVTTIVYAEPQRVYEFLLDFPGYAAYSEHLTGVTQRGDGGPGTRYDLRFAWWKLTYTARSKVTAVDPPTRIDWRITKDVDADGHWFVDPIEDPTDPRADVESVVDADAAANADDDRACRVRFRVDYDPDSAHVGAIDLPRFVSLAWVIDKVKPKIRSEATRIVERVVVDLEGQRRDVDLSVDTGHVEL